ncbi:MAG: hypothetical protein LUG96_02645 [Tannerellaceae bacterium]|nr:hypothetical protein [Tannerellaceae bacterium]MCD7914262.1 hypothetical protein [Tannerellaceae bacterium]
MNTVKNILIGIGVVAILLTIVFLVVGVKVVSTLLVYTVGAIAVIALICFAIFYLGKFFGRKSSDK